MLLDSLPPTTIIPLVHNTSGVYIGIDAISGASIYWDVELSLTPHVLVIGPSGSGKSVTLSSLVNRFVKLYNANAFIFDIKDEYRDLLSIYRNNGLTFLNPLEEPLPLCYCDDTSPKKLEMINTVVNSVSSVYPLSTQSKKYLIRTLADICTRCLSIDSDWHYGLEVYDKELNRAIDTLSTLFNVYPSRHNVNHKILDMLTVKKGEISIINLKHLFIRDRTKSVATVIHILNYLLSTLSTSSTSIPNSVVVIDELWHVIPFIGDELVNMLARYSRGLGLALFMATQGIDDLYPYIDTIVNSSGVFIAMSTPSMSYWQRLQQYLNLTKKAIDYIMNISGQGIAVTRVSPCKTPIVLYIDPLDNW
jgi:hypothetical protein